MSSYFLKFIGEILDKIALSHVANIISDILEKIIIFFMAAHLFLGGLVYGDEPAKVDITYKLTPVAQAYEPGDKIEMKVITKNVGRPFKEELTSLRERNLVAVYTQTEDGFFYLYDSLKQDSHGAKSTYIISHNQKQTYSISFTIPEDAPKGKYSISFYYRTTETRQIYADAIEVK